ncbi:hypothetical protein [Flavobacterium sp. H122]|uniref:hypothetical protein n=1 Tax=Flavobacterium sp. H122 TaxID=2529860 RepID=UPI0010AA3BF2|nr:hypothetical protein [Flavobacterium sp. H122]
MKSALSLKLNQAIATAELQQKNALSELKEEFLQIKQNYEPSNLIGLLSNNFLSVQNTDFKRILKKTALTLAIGFISKKLTQKTQNSALQKTIHKASEFFLNKFS